MKKLMIAFAAVALAMGVEAATINWKVAAARNANQLNGYTGVAFGSKTGDTMYLINDSMSSSIIEALGKGTLSGTTAGVYDVVDSGFNSYGGLSNYLTSDDKLTEGTSYDFSVLLVSKDASGNVYYDLGSALEGKYPTTTQAVSNLDFSKSLNFSTQTWTAAAATPEPTSGLLLLLGMGALALRRRRA